MAIDDHLPAGASRRGLVPFEIAAVLAIAVLPFPAMVPVALPLFVAATIARWIRRRTWAEVTKGSAMHALVGALVGAVALGIAFGFATQGLASLSQRSFEWSELAIVRDNLQATLIVGAYVAVTAIAAELALRGWIVERMLELSPGSPVLPIAIGALAEAVVTPGDIVTRLGAALFGAGLGWLYVAGGRSVVAPICARVAFQSGAVVLEALRLFD